MCGGWVVPASVLVPVWRFPPGGVLWCSLVCSLCGRWLLCLWPWFVVSFGSSVSGRRPAASVCRRVPSVGAPPPGVWRGPPGLLRPPAVPAVVRLAVVRPGGPRVCRVVGCPRSAACPAPRGPPASGRGFASRPWRRGVWGGVCPPHPETQKRNARKARPDAPSQL